MRNDSKKTIIFVTADSNKSGVPVHLQSLISGLHNDFKIILIAPQGWLTKEVKKMSVEVYEISVNLKNILKFRNIYSNFPKDTIIHSHGIKSGLAGRIAALGLGSKIIYTEHNWTKDYEIKSKWKKSFQLFALKILAKYTHTIICVSKAVKNFYIEKGILTDSKLKVIYNGVNFYNWNKISRESIIVGTIGTLDHRKGMDILISGFADLLKNLNSPAILKILGSGAEKENLKKLSQNLNIENKLEFVGNEMNVGDFLDQIDIYIQPSRDESFGMALCEAIGSAVPSIASDVGAIPEIMPDEKLLFKKEDPKDLSAKLKNLISQFDDYKKKFENYKTITQEKFNVNRMISEYKTFYDSL